MIIFFDLQNSDIEILDDDGEFWFHNFDTVMAERDPNYDGHWVKLNKMQDITPLNDANRFELSHPDTGELINLGSADTEIVQMVHRAARDPDWRDVE